jgi:hypothetical protein
MSLFIPIPRAFVRVVLATLAQGNVTPYWTYALVAAVMGLVPPKVTLVYTHSLLKGCQEACRSKTGEARIYKCLKKNAF